MHRMMCSQGASCSMRSRRACSGCVLLGDGVVLSWFIVNPLCYFKQVFWLTREGAPDTIKRAVLVARSTVKEGRGLSWLTGRAPTGLQKNLPYEDSPTRLHSHVALF